MVQYSFTSTETRRLIKMDSPGQPPRFAHSSCECFLQPFYIHSWHAGLQKRTQSADRSRPLDTSRPSTPSPLGESKVFLLQLFLFFNFPIAKEKIGAVSSAMQFHRHFNLTETKREIHPPWASTNAFVPVDFPILRSPCRLVENVSLLLKVLHNTNNRTNTDTKTKIVINATYN